MKKQSLIAMAAACVVLIMVASGCSGQGAPSDQGARTAENVTMVILVENTSVSLPVEYFKSDRDLFMQSIHSFFNGILEGKSR